MRSKKIFHGLVLFALVSLMSGCVNLAMTRISNNGYEIEQIYQSTEESFTFATVIMFPQMMSSSHNDVFMAENIITIPIGLLCMCDVPLEFVIDTICLPYDYYVAKDK